MGAPAGGDRPRKAFDDGDFRWAATLLDHAIFTDQNHASARELYADTLEQLAYGAENAVWRNFFLAGATELRVGNFGTPTQTASPSILGQLTPEQMFDTSALSVNGPTAWNLDVAVDVTFLDVNTNYRLTLRNGVLVYPYSGDMPALLISRSTLPNRSYAASTNPSSSSQRPTCTRYGNAARPVSAAISSAVATQASYLRLAMTTSAPHTARPRRPSPGPARGCRR